jgi:hypothetical protein
MTFAGIAKGDYHLLNDIKYDIFCQAETAADIKSWSNKALALENKLKLN